MAGKSMGHLALKAQGLELKDRQPNGWDDFNLPKFRVTTVRRIVVCRNGQCKSDARRQLGETNPTMGADPYINPERNWGGPQIFNTELREGEAKCGICGAEVSK